MYTYIRICICISTYIYSNIYLVSYMHICNSFMHFSHARRKWGGGHIIYVYTGVSPPLNPFLKVIIRKRSLRVVAHLRKETFGAVCCSISQCVQCLVLQCVAVCCSVLQCVAVCCIISQCVAGGLSLQVIFRLEILLFGLLCKKRPAWPAILWVFANLQYTASHCITLQHTATHCNTAIQCNTLQHSNTLQHTATPDIEHSVFATLCLFGGTLTSSCAHICVHMHISICVCLAACVAEYVLQNVCACFLPMYMCICVRVAACVAEYVLRNTRRTTPLLFANVCKHMCVSCSMCCRILLQNMCCTAHLLFANVDMYICACCSMCCRICAAEYMSHNTPAFCQCM